jgi:hypothetical protein
MSGAPPGVRRGDASPCPVGQRDASIDWTDDSEHAVKRGGFCHA